MGLLHSTIRFPPLNFPKSLIWKANKIAHWLGRLPELGIVQSKGRTKGTTYEVNPDFLKSTQFKGKTTLKRIESYRLEELIYQDVKICQPTSISEINERIGTELSRNKIQKALKRMCEKKIRESERKLKSTKYFIRQE